MKKLHVLHGNLVIRADAFPSIGTGHVMRCLALAQAWQYQGGRVTFVMAEGASALETRLRQEGINVERLSSPPGGRDDAIETINLADALGANWVVVDGYHFDSQYQKVIKDSGLSLLFVDDTAHAVHYSADIVLNQNIFANKRLYVNRDPYTHLLLGTKYVLLRGEFLRFRGWKREISQLAQKVLVTLGGGDPDNVTLKVIQALNQMDLPELEVKVVVGPSNPNKEILINAMRHAPCAMHIAQNVKDMADLMAWADMAVTAGGSTCWEMAFMGLPSLIVTVADNQVGIAEGLGKAGAGIDLGWHEDISIKHCTQALKEILQDKNKRSRLSERGQKMVNGKGRQKIIKAMLAGQIKLRRAQENDCELLWKWANDPKVRQSSFDSKDIAWEDHQAWFLNKQNDSNCIQYIALNSHDVPIGQIRFDIKDSVAEIDYSVDKNFRDMGLGKILLKEGVKVFCAGKEKPITIQGCVKKENEPSNLAFQSVGFF